MTLFRNVFSNQDADQSSPRIRTSYDLAMAPEPDDLVDMNTLSEMLSDSEQAKDPNPVDPAPEAVAEAQALLNSAAASPLSTQQIVDKGARNKTRLLGFSPASEAVLDPIRAADAKTDNSQGKFPTGWLVIIDGDGQGEHFPLFSGVASIGRGDNQVISLNFGDSSISRENHAAVAFDEEQNSFFLGHGGKSNIIRLNGKPVLMTEEIKTGDSIRIGETTLRLVTLCDSTFNWSS